MRRGRRSAKQRQEEEEEGEEEAGEQEAEEEEAPPSRRCAGPTLHSLVGSRTQGLQTTAKALHCKALHCWRQHSTLNYTLAKLRLPMCSSPQFVQCDPPHGRCAGGGDAAGAGSDEHRARHSPQVGWDEEGGGGWASAKSTAPSTARRLVKRSWCWAAAGTTLRVQAVAS